MSTRCNIILKDDKHKVILYHHCDGYPEGVGIYLYNGFHETLAGCRHIDLEDCVNSLLKDEKDHSYEWTCCIHRDIEYLYEIDTHNKTLRCWKYDGWNRKKGTEIDLSKLVKED